MDTSDAAALAALVVAILAIFVAILQAVQQYLLTGALIRLCDSVVFGKMPGRGRRVWEMSQFRFRVVYSIPQVSLHRDLWPGSLPHIPSYAKGSRSLPDLGLLEAKDDNSSSVQEGPWKAGSPANSVSFSPGEASWVSFCRAVQLSSGRSMVLDLVAGDADRCPSDLPNVPMPMSMRDIAVMGLMTGMKCTQASFEAKSLSMQGLVGTITTSQHPFLGPLLHFSPRNMSVNEIQDLQIGGGAVDPFWMSRMWDEVNVAGRRYTQDQRMKIEKDEASWARSLRERAVVPMSRNRSPPPSSLSGLRRRRSAGPELTKSSDTVVSSQSPEKQNGSGFVSSCKDDSCRTLWTRSDGDWSVDNRATVVDDTPNMVAQTIDTCQKTPPLRIKDKVKRHRRALLAQTWNIVFYKRHHSSKKTLDDPFNAELELGGTRVTPGVVPNPQRNMQDQNSGNRRNTQDQGANLPPRWWISNYIKEKRQVIEGDILENERPKGPLLIGWYDEDDQGIPELNEAEENIAKSVLEMWTRSRSDLESQRAAFYASRWRNVIQRRQMNREDRSRSRRAPARSSQRARTRSDSGRRYRSPDEKVPNQSLAESRRHYELRVPYYPPVYDDEAGTRSQAGYYQTNSPNIYARPSAPESGSRPRMPRDRGQYSESNVEDETVHRQSRPRSRVRSRPNDKVFEYGDGGIAGRIPEAWLNQKSPENSTSKSPVSPALDNSNERKPTNRVGFGPTIDVIDAPSSDEDANEDSKKTLPAEKESQEWEFVTPAQQFRLDYPHLSIPPSALSPRTDPGREVSPPPRQSYFPAHRRPSSPSSSSISPRTSSGRAISPPPRQSGSSAEKPKGILKPPRATFPEEANPIREGVAPLRDRKLPDEIPAGARWTKIDRRLVDVEALEAGNERFEERSDHVIVLRVLSKEEIQRYAVKTQEIRERQHLREIHNERELYDGRSRSGERRGRRRRRDRSDSSSPSSVNSAPDSPPRRHRQGRDDTVPKSPIFSPQSEDSFISRPSSRQTETRPRASRERIYVGFDNDSDAPSLVGDRGETRSSYSGKTYSIGWGDRSVTDLNTDDVDYDDLGGGNDWVSDYLMSPTGEMNWFWACQMDVMPGYMSTPWTTKFSTPVCIGAIAVIIEALGILTEFTQPVFIDSVCHSRGLQWMSSGRSTFPPYGISANHHHGIVIAGIYTTTNFPGFRAPLFPIELLRHYGFQVDRHLPLDTANLRARLSELMALDAWLSYCGRQSEICGHINRYDDSVPAMGVGDLLYTMPTLVERTMNSFTYEFTDLESTAIDGGKQRVQEIAEKLLDTLGWKAECLSPAEKLFTLVAMLRSAKMGLCIAQGTDTSALRDILLNDVQVHLT